MILDLIVQTAYGFPGNGETAISLTANPCLNILRLDLFPAAQRVYI